MKDKYFKDRLKEIESSGNLRRLQIITNSEKGVIVGNKEFTNLTSNDYLGIATDRHLIFQVFRKLKRIRFTVFLHLRPDYKPVITKIILF